MWCSAAECRERATFHISWFESRRCEREEHLCEDHARIVLTNLAFDRFKGVDAGERIPAAQCFDIRLIIISEVNDQQVVYLQEVNGVRIVPLLIGIFEATSLDRFLKGSTTPRPLTHNAMFGAIDALGGEVQDVMISDSREHTHFAHLRVRQGNEMVSIDIRPSDAFCLAVLAEKPIFISEHVLKQLGI